MVITCCACSEKYSQDKNLSFHLFPRDPTLKALWIKAINKKDFVLYEHSKICGQHFAPDALIYDPITGRRRVKPYAVPSIFNIESSQQENRPNVKKMLKNHFIDNQDNYDSSSSSLLEKQDYTKAPYINKKISNNQLSHPQASNLEQHPGLPKKIKFTPPRQYAPKATAPPHEMIFMDNRPRMMDPNPIQRKQNLLTHMSRNSKFPTKLYDTFLLAKRKIKEKNQQIRLLQQKNQRLTDRIDHLEHILCHLKENNLINKEAEHIIEIVRVNYDFFKPSMNITDDEEEDDDGNEEENEDVNEEDQQIGVH